MKQFGIALGFLAIASSVLSAPIALKADDIFYAQREGWGTCCNEGAADAKRSEASVDDIFYAQREGWGTINAAVSAANGAEAVSE
jgi:hypothetical protein